MRIFQSKRAIGALLGFTFILIAFSRLHYRQDRPSMDETIYMYVAHDIIRGGIPYKTSFDHKGPLMYLMIAAPLKLLGISVSALRFGGTIYLLLSCLLVYLLARELYGSAALLAPVLYGFFFSKEAGGMETNGELLMLLPTLAAMLVYIRAWNQERAGPGHAALAGFFAACACLIKANALFSLLIIPVLMLFDTRAKWKPAWLNFATFLFGGVATTLVTVLIFWKLGALNEFYLSYFSFNFNYVRYFESTHAIYLFVQYMSSMIGDRFIGALFLLSLWGLILHWEKNRKHALMMGVLFLGSAYGAYAAKQIVGHYFLQLAIPVALVPSAFLSLMKERVRFQIILGVLVILLSTNSLSFYKGAKSIFSIKSGHDPGTQTVADYLRENTTPEEGVLVYHPLSTIYHLAQRYAPIPFFNSYHYSPTWADSLGSIAALKKAIDEGRIKYIVTTIAFNKELPLILVPKYRLVKEVEEFMIYEKSQ